MTCSRPAVFKSFELNLHSCVSELRSRSLVLRHSATLSLSRLPPHVASFIWVYSCMCFRTPIAYSGAVRFQTWAWSHCAPFRQASAKCCSPSAGLGGPYSQNLFEFSLSSLIVACSQYWASESTADRKPSLYSPPKPGLVTKRPNFTCEDLKYSPYQLQARVHRSHCSILAGLI